MNHKWVKDWMCAYGVAIDDVEKLWFLLNRDNDSKITADELVEGVLDLRGPATSIDMKYFLHEFSALMESLGMRRSPANLSSSFELSCAKDGQLCTVAPSTANDQFSI